MPLARARPRRKGRNEEAPAPEAASDNASTAAQAQQMPAYARGHGAIAGVPLLDATPPQTMPVEDERTEPTQDQLTEQSEETQAPKEELPAEGPLEVSNQSPAPVSEISGEGEEIHAVAHSVTLEGRTDADYRSSFRTERVLTTPGTGCDGCTGGDCVHVRGTLVSSYTVTTTVTIPSVNDFPDLTPCQRRRVQTAINNVLRPHEQQHVSAFRTYNGTTRQRFDMTICRDALDAAIQSLHDAEQSTRQAAAQARSDALDPFTFDVDIDCEEPPAREKRSAADVAAPDDQEKEA
jgi:hypothetical protein